MVDRNGSGGQTVTWSLIKLNVNGLLLSSSLSPFELVIRTFCLIKGYLINELTDRKHVCTLIFLITVIKDHIYDNNNKNKNLCGD